VDGTVVRGTSPGSGSGSNGIRIELACSSSVCLQDHPAHVTVSRSLVEQNEQFGVYVFASEAIVDATVVRDTLPRAADQELGLGVAVRPCVPSEGCSPVVRARATVTRSVIERNHTFGMYVEGSDATLEASAIAGTLPEASNQTAGRGISVQPHCPQGVCDPSTRSSIEVLSSLLEQNHNAGLFVTGSDGVVESTVIRDTLPRENDRGAGFGISVQLVCNQGSCDPNMRANATVGWSVLERNTDSSMLIMGSDATVDATVMRDTSPRASTQAFGRGISIQPACTPTGCDPNARSNAAIHWSLVEGNHDVGVFIGGSDVTLDASVVRATSTRAQDGLFGDGVDLLGGLVAATAEVSRSRIEASARAGIASFGGSASLHQVAVACATFGLVGETVDAVPPLFEDRGENQCGCPNAEDACKVQGAGLAPPDPLDESN
jgi:hypothetical protein